MTVSIIHLASAVQLVKLADPLAVVSMGNGNLFIVPSESMAYHESVADHLHDLGWEWDSTFERWWLNV